MLWEHVRAGLFDELEKISAVDLRGLAPETLMAQQPPQPMMTEGYNKAKAILDRAQMNKTAAASRASRKVQQAFPNQPGIGKMVNQGDNSTNEKIKSVAGYGLAGLGTGKVLSELGTGSPWAQRWKTTATSPQALAQRAGRLGSMGWGATVAGGATGLWYGLYRQHQKARAQMAKTSNIATPGMQLKASQQVAKPHIGPSIKGPSINSQIGGSLIGHKFTQPGVPQ